MGETTGDATAQAAGTSQAQEATTTGEQGATAQAAAATSSSPATGGEAGGGTGGTLSPEALEKELAEARREAAANRRAAADAKKALEELRGKSLTEEERKTQELETLREQAKTAAARERELVLGYEVALEAGRMGLDPRLVTKLLDSSTVEWDDAGRPKELRKALEGLVAEYPVLRPAAAASGTATGAPARTGSALTKDSIRRMTPEEIEARWPEVQTVLSS